MSLLPAQRVLVALDTTDVDEAAALARRLVGWVGGIKLGKEFFTANGPAGVERVTAGGMPLFLDLKFHDIPNTVAGAIAASVRLRPLLVNVHASGGETMMKAAAEAAHSAAAKLGVAPPKVLAVTVLTSLEAADLAAVGVAGSVEDQVKRLAVLAQRCGMDGVVCSAREIDALRAVCGKDFLLVVPGIRPIWAGADDQKRRDTPAGAVARGADYLVIGRPITRDADPVAAAQRIADELAAGA